MAISPIVVGVDGSELSFEAATWAADEAVRRKAPLHLLITNDDPARAEYVGTALREAGTRCRARSPELDLTESVTTGHPVEELVNRSSTAQMTVLGSRGHGPVATALLGSVSKSVTEHSAGPVVIVRGKGAASGPVVVGVDGSPYSTAALGFAFEAAQLRDAELLVLRAWHSAAEDYELDDSGTRERVQDLVERRLHEQVTGWAEKYPGVRIREVALRGHPVALLTDASKDAQLLVVGHRGIGGFEELLLGSVANGVVHHATGPVAVVRPTR